MECLQPCEMLLFLVLLWLTLYTFSRLNKSTLQLKELYLQQILKCAATNHVLSYSLKDFTILSYGIERSKHALSKLIYTFYWC
ncbi:hypothetical protein C0J52_04143 [Blattella germanica]|nr:hypothetical protein C0J52_04143 [Blattella germanica]